MNQPGHSFIKFMHILLFSGISFCSLADEAALYDLAPQGSAFLRIIDLRKEHIDKPMPERLTLPIQNKRLSTVGYCSASEFIYLPAGDYRKEINAMLWRAELEPDQAYSLLIADDSLRLLRDYPVTDSRRAMLAVYNFSPFSTVSLNTAKSARTVFATIPQGESVAREINPLKSAFTVVNRGDRENTHLAVTAPMIFQPGVLSSLFICNDRSGIFTRWAYSMGGQ